MDTSSVSRERILEHVRRLSESPGSDSSQTTPQSKWTLHPRTLELVKALIQDMRPTSVLEFGAGLSSVAITRALTETPGARLTSVDHAPEYCLDQWALVEAERRVDTRLVEGRLQLRLRAEGLFYTYSGVIDAIAARGPYDFVLIDGPPGNYGRDATLHLAWPHLKPGALIVLDDYQRVREQWTVRQWLTRYSGLRALCLDPRFFRGVAIMRHDGPHITHSWLRAYVASFYALYAFRGDRARSLAR